MKAFLLISIDKYSKFLFGIIAFVLMSKSLGPHQFGQYNYYQAIVSIAAISCFSSIDALIQRDTISNKLEYGHGLYIGLYLKYITSSLGFLIGLIYLGTDNPVGMLLLLSVLVLPLDLSSYLLQARKCFNIIAKLRLYINLTFLILRVSLFLYKPSILLFSLLYISELLIFNLLTTKYLLTNCNVKLIKPNNLLNLMYRYMKEGSYLLISFAALILYTKLDILFIEHYHGVKLVGEYALSIRVLDISTLFASVLSMYFTHRLVESYCRFKNKYLFIAALASFAIAILCHLFLPFLIIQLFGEEYERSAMYIAYTSLLIFPSTMMLTTGKLLILQRRSVDALVRNILCLPIAIITNYLTIPIYGVYGAIMSTGIVLTLASLLALFNLKETNNA
ncbi:polysaccharide biosynthesis C-terminal domain-containing protein [Vibrio breoganii]